MSTTARRFRDLLAGSSAIVLPGAYDALTARLAEQAGFDGVYVTGYGVSASMIGEPDVGLVTMTEMSNRAAQIAAAVSVPVIADADTGYGNALNVRRTIQAYERAGLAGLHIEDQVTPKRCGHMTGKSLISTEEMVGKIRAAVEARRDDDFTIIARTDARAVTGLDDAIGRAKAYAQAGATAVFVEAPQSEDEVSFIANALRPLPLVMNMATGSTIDGAKTPPLSVDVLERLGYKIILFPVQAIYAAASAVRDTFALIRAGVPLSEVLQRMRMIGFTEFNEILGLGSLRELESRYAPESQLQPPRTAVRSADAVAAKRSVE